MIARSKMEIRGLRKPWWNSNEVLTEFFRLLDPVKSANLFKFWSFNESEATDVNQHLHPQN